MYTFKTSYNSIKQQQILEYSCDKNKKKRVAIAAKLHLHSLQLQLPATLVPALYQKWESLLNEIRYGVS